MVIMGFVYCITKKLGLGLYVTLIMLPQHQSKNSDNI